jgi:hypothetical protein
LQEGTAKDADMSIAINETLGKKFRSRKIRDQQKVRILLMLEIFYLIFNRQ